MNRAAQMRAFDALPRSARAALANACFNWPAGPLLVRWRRAEKGHRNGAELVARVAAWDRLQHRADARRGKVAPL